jgi:hypothetical protein
MALRCVRTGSRKCTQSLQKGVFLPFQNLELRMCPLPDSNWLVERLGEHKNLVFLKYKQNRSMFSLGDINCRIPAPVIERGSVVRVDACAVVRTRTVVKS